MLTRCTIKCFTDTCLAICPRRYTRNSFHPSQLHQLPSSQVRENSSWRARLWLREIRAWLIYSLSQLMHPVDQLTRQAILEEVCQQEKVSEVSSHSFNQISPKIYLSRTYQRWWKKEGRSVALTVLKLQKRLKLQLMSQAMTSLMLRRLLELINSLSQLTSPSLLSPNNSSPLNNNSCLSSNCSRELSQVKFSVLQSQ